MLFIGTIVQRLAGLRMELLSLPTSNLPIELDVRRVKLRLTSLQRSVEALNQSCHFVTIEIPVVIVQIVEVGSMRVLGLVVPPLHTPNVGPMRRGRMIRAKQVVGAGDPFVEIFLNQPS